MPQINYTLPLDQLPDPLPIEPLTKPFDVTITPPGSKSITCRAYVLAALAEGESKILRPLRADDTDHLLNALCTLGAEARWVKGENHDGEDVYIKGVAGCFPRGGNLYMGEGGTPTRFMIACACLAKEPVVIDASPRMRERPIAEGVDMLRQLGAQIEYVDEEGRLPVRVVPNNTLVGGEIEIRKTASRQFISALLLIGSQLQRGISLKFVEQTTSSSYIYLTTWTLDQWLLPLQLTEFIKDAKSDEMQHRRINLPNQLICCGSFTIEPDASSCTYWLGAAALNPGSRATIPMQPLASGQPDRSFGLDIAQLFGCQFEFLQDVDGSICSSALVGPDQLSLGNPNTDSSLTPDSSMTVAVIVARAPSGMRITGLRTLRVKETDRIAALATELRKVGCVIETGEDWIEITPPNAQGSSGARAAESREDTAARSVERPIIIETYNDHRMAMAFAVLGLNPPNGVPLAIRNPKCVAKSYPGFWKDFARLYQ